jgi:cytochrome c55X
MRSLQRCAIALALAGACTVAAAQDPAPAPLVDPVEAGRRLYVSSCQRCHGIRLVSFGLGYDLRNFPQQDKERFIRSVSKGLRAMPAWGDTMKPEQMDLIWTYIGSINGWKTEGQPP